jgi:hypothetical protein
MVSSDTQEPTQGLTDTTPQGPRAESVLLHPWVRAILDTDLSAATKDQYVRNLSVLQKLSDRRPLEDLIKYPRAAYARIESAYSNDQTKKAMVSAIKGVFKHVPGLKEQYPQSFEEWNSRFKTLDKLIFDRLATAEPTDRERANWVPWNDVVAKERELAYSRYGSPDHLMLAMYTLIEPLRADFGVIKILEKHPPSTDQGTSNFIVMQPTGSGQLILNAYKTSKKYGRFEREIPDSLLNIIRASLSTQPRAYLFVDDQGKPYVIKNSYIRYANRTFAKIFGKNLTIRLLRHAFISNLNFNTSTPATLIGHSKMMLHSLGMQQMYRRHVDPVLSTSAPYPPRHAPLPPPSGPPHAYYNNAPPVWQQPRHHNHHHHHHNNNNNNTNNNNQHHDAPQAQRPYRQHATPHTPHNHHRNHHSSYQNDDTRASHRNRNRSSRPHTSSSSSQQPQTQNQGSHAAQPKDGGLYVYV